MVDWWDCALVNRAKNLGYGLSLGRSFGQTTTQCTVPHSMLLNTVGLKHIRVSDFGMKFVLPF